MYVQTPRKPKRFPSNEFTIVPACILQVARAVNTKCALIIKKEQVGKDQEKAQSEKDFDVQNLKTRNKIIIKL